MMVSSSLSRVSRIAYYMEGQGAGKRRRGVSKCMGWAVLLGHLAEQDRIT
jgi:hypothetical protein